MLFCQCGRQTEAVCVGPSLREASQRVPSRPRSHRQHSRTGRTSWPSPSDGLFCVSLRKWSKLTFPLHPPPGGNGWRSGQQPSRELLPEAGAQRDSLHHPQAGPRRAVTSQPSCDSVPQPWVREGVRVGTSQRAGQNSNTQHPYCLQRRKEEGEEHEDEAGGFKEDDDDDDFQSTTQPCWDNLYFHKSTAHSFYLGARGSGE